MSPTLQDRQLVLAFRLPGFLLRPGRMVIVKTDSVGYIVKRIASVSKATVTLCSDNAATHSRFCNIPICKSHVVAVVGCKLF